MMGWAGRRPWLAVRTVIRAVTMAHHEQVRMWECVLLTSGAAPLSAAGPLRWVRSLDGYRLAGSYLPAQDPAERGGNPGRRPPPKIPASAPPAATAHPRPGLRGTHNPVDLPRAGHQLRGSPHSTKSALGIREGRRFAAR